MSFESEYFPERRRVRPPIPFTSLTKALAFLASGAIVTGMLLKMTGHEIPEAIASPAVFAGGVFLALLYYLSIGRIGSACFDGRRRLSHRVVLMVCFAVMLLAISYMLVGYLLTLLTDVSSLAEVYSPAHVRQHPGLTMACVAFVILLDTIVFGANFLELSDEAIQEPELRQALARAQSQISQLEIASRQLEIASRDLESRHREELAAIQAESARALEEELGKKQLELDRSIEVAMGGAPTDLEIFRALWHADAPVEARWLKEQTGRDAQIMLGRLLERGDVERIPAPKEFRSDWLWRALRQRNGARPAVLVPEAALSAESSGGSADA